MISDHSPGPVDPAIRAWFEALQDCVQREDFTSARALFTEDVVAFGTRARIVSGLEALEAEQWRGIWPNIRDFRFDLSDVRGGISDDLAWAVATWDSTGFADDGTPFERGGRASVIFVRRDGGWCAIHSHFSLAPGTPPRTRRPS